MTARIVASLAFGWFVELYSCPARSSLSKVFEATALAVNAVLGRGEGSSWMRGWGERESLKACERRFWSVRRENVVSRSRVRIWEKVGESMRSEVSSRSRRRGKEVAVRGGEGEGVNVGFAAVVDAGVVDMPVS